MKDCVAPSPKVKSSNVRIGAILPYANHDRQKRRSDHPSTVNFAPVRLASITPVHRSGSRVLVHVARKKVLDTPELMEHVLSFLAAAVLLTRARRVCHTWNNSIMSSPTIETKLRMKSETVEPMSPKEYSTREWFPARDWKMTVTRLPIYATEMTFNTLATARKHPFMSVYIRNDPDGHRVEIAMHQFELRPSSHAERLAWREMLLTEPPIIVARVQSYLPQFVEMYICPRRGGLHHYPCDWVAATICEDSGLTFGAVAGVVERIDASLPDGWASRAPSYWKKRLLVWSILKNE